MSVLTSVTKSSLLLPFLLVSLFSSALAQPSEPCLGDDCNEWTVPTPLPHVEPAAGDRAAPEPQKEKPPCTKDDSLACAEDCRREFGDEYRKCNSQCLSPRCTVVIEKKKSPDEERRDAYEGAICLQDNSEECRARCEQEDGPSTKTRCRRNCLQQRCPEADRYDTATESFDPGKIACVRCRQEFISECRRTCVTGILNRGKIEDGLSQAGCEKVCLATSCSKSCPLL